MEMREWLSLIVILILVLILLDGFRRRWVDRKNRVLIKINTPNGSVNETNGTNRNPELPGDVRTSSRENQTSLDYADAIDAPVNHSLSFSSETEDSFSTATAGHIEPSFTEGESFDDLFKDNYSENSDDKLKTSPYNSNERQTEPVNHNPGNGRGKQDTTEVIVINIMPKSGELFSGKELLPLLQQLGMRLGDMSIFHRHADSSGEGPVMFSMANMVEPGTFDIESMNSFTTPGISFFLQLPNSLGNMSCFEKMLDATTTIKNNLDGELKDENRSFITRQTIEHCRQRILDFELKQKLQQADK